MLAKMASHPESEPLTPFRATAQDHLSRSVEFNDLLSVCRMVVKESPHSKIFKEKPPSRTAKAARPVG
jgi:hypothetical protein